MFRYCNIVTDSGQGMGSLRAARGSPGRTWGHLREPLLGRASCLHPRKYPVHTFSPRNKSTAALKLTSYIFSLKLAALSKNKEKFQSLVEGGLEGRTGESGGNATFVFDLYFFFSVVHPNLEKGCARRSADLHHFSSGGGGGEGFLQVTVSQPS